MIQSHLELQRSCQEYNILFSKNEFYPLQKAYSTPHFIVLCLRFPGKNLFLYIGRGAKYQGLFIGEKAPPSYLRIQDKFLDYLRKYLVGTRLGKVEFDTNHFVFLFPFKNDTNDNSFVFGYKNNQLFFMNQVKSEIYTSWNSLNHHDVRLTSLIDELFENEKSTLRVKDCSKDITSYLNDEKNKQAGEPLLKKREKFLARKIGNISSDLVDVSQRSKLEEFIIKAELEKIPDGELVFENIKIKFTPGLSAWKKRDIIFQKIKKLKKAELILNQRLIEAKDELAKVQQGEMQLEITKEKPTQVFWKMVTVNIAKKNDFSGIVSFKLGEIYGEIGLNAEANDLIRINGHKEFFWFHIENYTSSHCLLKTDNLSILSGSDFSALASMLRDFSKLEISEIPLIYSQLKNIKGLKGSKGSVLVKKPKYLRCLYVEWKEIITLK
jgi:hypothetical protein